MLFLGEVRFNKFFNIEEELFFSLLLIVIDLGLFVKDIEILVIVSVFLVNEYVFMFIVDD